MAQIATFSSRLASNDPTLTPFKDALVQAESTEQSRPNKASRAYKKALKELSKIPKDKVSDDISSISQDIKQKIASLDAIKDTSNSPMEFAIDGVEDSEKKGDSGPIPKLKKSSKSNTSGSIVANSTEAEKPKKKKKSKRSGVRFVEQKKLFFYDEDTPPTTTNKISSGFTSMYGLDDSQYEPLVRELIRIALIPVSTRRSPMPESEVLEHLRKAFNLDENNWQTILEDEKSKWNIYEFITALIHHRNNLENHPFYRPETFKDNNHIIWMEQEKIRLDKLIARLKVRAPDYDQRTPIRVTPSRSRSKSGIEESSSTTASGRPERKNPSRQSSGAPNHTVPTLSVSQTPTGSARLFHQDSHGSLKRKPTMASTPTPVSLLANNVESDDSDDAPSNKKTTATPPAVGSSKKPEAAQDEDSSQREPSESTSSDGGAWTGRAPRVAIKPLQFAGDTDSEDDKFADEPYSAGSLSKGGAIEQPDDYSGSSPPSPRRSKDDRRPSDANREKGNPDFAQFGEDDTAFAENRDMSEEVKQEVDTSASRFELLFNVLMSYENSNLKNQERRIKFIMPLLDKAHEAISSQFSLDTHVNMFDPLPCLNPDAFISGFSGINFFLDIPDTTPFVDPKPAINTSSSSSSKKKQQSTNDILVGVPNYDPISDEERQLIGLSPVSRWLLGEYSVLWGYSPLYQNLVLLHHVVSFLSPAADKLLLLYVLMTRVLDILQADEVEPVPSALEEYYFAQIMRELNRDADNSFYNIFSQFGYEDMAGLKMLLNILSLIYECNEYLGEAPPKTYKAYLEQALEESIQNYYKEVLASAEEPREISGDPVGTNTSAVVRKRQRYEKRSTADQLLAACEALKELLTHLEPFSQLFQGLSKPLFDICCRTYVKQLFSDTSLFVIMMARTQPLARVLALANGIISINNMCESQAKGIIEPLPVEKLFGSFLQEWLNHIEASMREWVNTTCKIDRWQAVDAAKGKMWSHCSWDLYKLCLSHIPLVKDNEVLFALALEAEQAEQSKYDPGDGITVRSTNSGTKQGLSNKINYSAIGYVAESLIERKKTFFYQYSLVISRILRDFIESIYNLFVEEFPVDLHSDLHDLYIRDYYNMTTGGTGLHMMYKKKKKTLFEWFTGRRSKESGDDPDRVAGLNGSQSQPKLGRRKSSGTLLSKQDGSAEKSKESDDVPPPQSKKGQSQDKEKQEKQQEEQNDDPNRELIINVWNLVVYDPKKSIKFQKLRKRIDIKSTMCIKLNDLDALRAFFDRLIKSESFFQLATNPAFLLMHKVFRTFLHMIIYVMNMYLDNEMEHIWKKSTKKPPSSVFEAHTNFISNLTDQLALMKSCLRGNIFKRIVLRIWKVILEDMEELLHPDDDDESPTPMQLSALEDLIDSIRPVLESHGMSTAHINGKISELMTPVINQMKPEELWKAKSVYQAEKDKHFYKDKKKGAPVTPTISKSRSATISGPSTGVSLASSPSAESVRSARADSHDDSQADSFKSKPNKAASKEELQVSKSSVSNIRPPLVENGSASKLKQPTHSHSRSTSASSTAQTASTSKAKPGLSHQASASDFIVEKSYSDSEDAEDAYANIKEFDTVSPGSKRKSRQELEKAETAPAKKGKRTD